MSKGDKNRVSNWKAWDNAPLWDHIAQKRKKVWDKNLEEKKEWKKKKPNK